MADPKLVSISSDTHSEFEAYIAVDDKGQVWRGQPVFEGRGKIKNVRIEWETIECRFRGYQ
jgi:hypothetical protein